MKLKRFSDFAKEEPQLEGDKIRIDDVLNLELIITGYRINNSKFKESKYVQLQVEINSKSIILLNLDYFSVKWYFILIFRDLIDYYLAAGEYDVLFAIYFYLQFSAIKTIPARCVNCFCFLARAKVYVQVQNFLQA